MSLNVKKISILKTEMAAGLHPLVISDIKLHKKSNGEPITYDDCPGVIFTFKNPEDQIHQEIYWIGGYNYTKFQKLMIAIDLDPALQHDKKEVVGKHVWGVIKSTITMRGQEQIKEEKRLSETLKFSLERPNYNQEVIEYKQDTFNQDQAF